MHFEVRPSGKMWEWVLVSDAREVLAESYRTFPTETQAQAAAMAWSKMVARAGMGLGR